MNRDPLTIPQILAWAEAPGETWHAVDAALRNGVRGLPGGSSLFQVMAARHKIRLHRRIPSVSTAQILSWAKKYFARYEERPTTRSGRIAGTSGVTWGAVDQMLVDGYRGLPGGSSLSKLLRNQIAAG